MLGSGSDGGPEPIGFFLVPKFTMIAFASAVEPLRSTNRMSGRELYSWHLFSSDGGPVAASNGIALTPEAAIASVEKFPTMIVCGGLDVHLYHDKAVFSWLRRLARQGTRIGAICTGSYVLARAGLLDDYRCTVHWENLPGFMEEFPHIEVTDDIFEIDRNRFTSSGGTAPLDMILHMIALAHGHQLAAAVSEQFIHDRIRSPDEHQRMALQFRLRIGDPKLLAAIAEMEANLEEPLKLPAVAAQVGLSTRQLERLFRRYLKRTPSRYYRELRLNHARLMLLQGSSSILGVALACGFVSASHFSKCYREHFGNTPREERPTA